MLKFQSAIKFWQIANIYHNFYSLVIYPKVWLRLDEKWNSSVLKVLLP